jgi:hypothetical protein
MTTNILSLVLGMITVLFLQWIGESLFWYSFYATGECSGKVLECVDRDHPVLFPISTIISGNPFKIIIEPKELGFKLKGE